MSFRSDKQQAMVSLNSEIARSRVDQELLPYIERINVIPWMYTILSCMGHDAQPGYIQLISESNTLEKYIPAIASIPGVLSVDKTWRCDEGLQTWYSINFDPGIPEVLECIVAILEIDSERGNAGR